MSKTNISPQIFPTTFTKEDIYYQETLSPKALVRRKNPAELYNLSGFNKWPFLLVHSRSLIHGRAAINIPAQNVLFSSNQQMVRPRMPGSSNRKNCFGCQLPAKDNYFTELSWSATFWVVKVLLMCLSYWEFILNVVAVWLSSQIKSLLSFT